MQHVDFQLQAPVFELLYRVARLDIPSYQRDELVASIPSDVVRNNLMQIEPASFVVSLLSYVILLCGEC